MATFSAKNGQKILYLPLAAIPCEVWRKILKKDTGMVHNFGKNWAQFLPKYGSKLRSVLKHILDMIVFSVTL